MNLRSEVRQSFPEDDRFTAAQWKPRPGFGRSGFQWRSYFRASEEVARVLLVHQFLSHSATPSTHALLISNFEVREDLRASGDRIGTRIVHDIVDEFRDQEIYIGPTPTSTTFWAKFRWPMCGCGVCRGRDFIVRRP